ncbi:tRNA-intron endonuclease [Sphaceloma murrayae]|uniref:tRNA-splicing endonuclease subunit Sen2 n=1 Tax=Sphaceloma murrayae TaxID=2082308 RepID=A0A2K1QNE0_9PEZI|nr:tRNA-intron endonuclease [Sphaceloma murrayae]
MAGPEILDVRQQPPTAIPNGPSTSQAGQPTSGANPRPKRPPKPNYARIHAKSLPMDVFPLPAFVPHNPLSLLRILGALINELYSRPASRPGLLYDAYFSPETRSVHVVDSGHVRALWEMGFFGKGILSRSEPSWLDREQARRQVGLGATAEEATSKRREDRRMFKLERARAEREAIEAQLKKEGKLSDLRPETSTGAAIPKYEGKSIEPGIDETDTRTRDFVAGIQHAQTNNDRTTGPLEHAEDLIQDAPIVDQEHLQLNLCEAFFLTYGLGVLSVTSQGEGNTTNILSAADMLRTFACHSIFPPIQSNAISPDNPFLMSYVVYHHYRSMGWVVRPGAKFACDWLLYNRGPVFSHAEFAIVIVPEYPGGGTASSEEMICAAKKKWWDFHCTNRVQSQVRKTLVLCYVQVPKRILPSLEGKANPDIGKIFRQYKVRDFVVRRWLANRSRD